MILVIDDHADTCRLVARFIEILGIESECLSEPQRGTAVIEQLGPTLVILDDNMPEVTGLELLGLIRAHSNQTVARTPVIMYSAGGDSTRMNSANELGIVAWISKGGGVADLLPLVRKFAS